MEKNRSNQIIAIIGLGIGIMGLSIGFAAFSKVLKYTIKCKRKTR